MVVISTGEYLVEVKPQIVLWFDSIHVFLKEKQ